MSRMAMFLCVVPLLAACQQEVISRRDSLSGQFAQMNKMGWTVDDQGRPKPSVPSQQADANVHVIRQADFSGYQFHTNFQVDDPRFPNANQPQPGFGDPNSPNPGNTPNSGNLFGPAPAGPH